MSKITAIAACAFLAATFVLAPASGPFSTAGQRAGARAASRIQGAELPAPEYPGGLSAGYCPELGNESWGVFRTRTDAENFARRLPGAASLSWCPIKL